MAKGLVIGVALALAAAPCLYAARGHSASAVTQGRLRGDAPSDPLATASRQVRVVYPPSNASGPVSADLVLSAAPEAPAAPVTSAAAPVSVAALDDNPPPVAADPAADLRGHAVDINAAPVQALDHLEGAGRIGRAIARHRPYRSVDDLLRKRVVRRDLFERIKEQLAVN